MNITVMSDLHLNFSSLNGLPGGDILILAGDIIEVGDIKLMNKHRANYQKFFDEETSKYNQVLYVYGNHEYYGGDFNETDSLIKSMLPMNVTVLQDSYIKIDDVYFYGATMWTDIKNEDPLTVMSVEQLMCDYTDIHHGKTKLKTHHTVKAHKESKTKLLEFLKLHKQDKVVVITHHAPSWKSIEDRYKGTTISHAYATELSEIILDNPQIRYWVHGHTHTITNYNIGKTTVVSNPRGYVSTAARDDERYSMKFAIKP